MNINLRLAVQFVLGAYTAQDIVGDTLDWRYIITNSNRFRLPLGAQILIENEAIQYCVDQGYLMKDDQIKNWILTEKGFQAIRQ